MTDQINDEILDILAKHAEMEREKVTPSTSLDMIGVDSLKLVEIIFDLERYWYLAIFIITGIIPAIHYDCAKQATEACPYGAITIEKIE